MLSVESQLTSRRKISSPSSGSKNKPRKSQREAELSTCFTMVAVYKNIALFLGRDDV
jgi:hypothetical protein